MYKCNKYIQCVLLILLTLSCGRKNVDWKEESLKIAVLPEENEKVLSEKYSPLVQYLQSSLNIKVEVVPVASYENILKLFSDREVDIALFGGATYVSANINSNARALVMRDEDLKFSSYIIVQKDAEFKSIYDLKDKMFAFGSELSTSGHFMPRYFLSELDVIPEKYFASLTYTGAHDKTAQMVNNREVDGGALNALIYNRLFQDGKLENTKVIWVSPPYVDYVWAAQELLPKIIIDNLIKAFLSLDSNAKDHKVVLDKLNAKYFLPASDSDFEKLKSIMLKEGAIR